MPLPINVTKAGDELAALVKDQIETAEELHKIFGTEMDAEESAWVKTRKDALKKWETVMKLPSSRW
jgi:hypothetical protein